MLRNPEGLWNITDSKVRHTVTPSAPETGSAAAKHIHQTENRYRRPTPSQIGGLRISDLLDPVDRRCLSQWPKCARSHHEAFKNLALVVGNWIGRDARGNQHR